MGSLPNSEATPTAIMEALACGVPVVASDVGGVHEAVIDGVTGWRYPAADPDAFAERAVRLLDDPDLVRTMGDAGERLAREKFAIEESLAAHLRAFSRALARRPSKRRRAASARPASVYADTAGNSTNGRRDESGSEPLSRRAKWLVRDTLIRVLRFVPLRPLLAVRNAYLRSPKGSLRRRALQRALGVIRLKPLDDVTDFAIPDNPAVRMANVESFIAQNLFWFGESNWEESESEWWKRLCARSSVILELGANIGYYTVQGALAAPHARYIAVEPHPTNAASLRRNLALNQVTNVRLVEAAAVGEKSSEYMDLRVATRDRFGAPAAAALAAGVEGIEWAARDVVRVPLIDVRELIDGVDLIKMDIEGAEHLVLGVLHDYVRAHQPTIVLELRANTPALRAIVGQFCDACGYQVLALAPNGIAPIERDAIPSVDLKREYQTRDVVLATPQIAADVFGSAIGSVPAPDHRLTTAEADLD
jgi:FkbM family methyltransferase